MATLRNNRSHSLMPFRGTLATKSHSQTDFPR